MFGTSCLGLRPVFGTSCLGPPFGTMGVWDPPFGTIGVWDHRLGLCVFGTMCVWDHVCLAPTIWDFQNPPKPPQNPPEPTSPQPRLGMFGTTVWDQWVFGLTMRRTRDPHGLLWTKRRPAREAARVAC